MRQKAVSWLPDSTLTGPRSAEAAARCFEDWAGDWLTEPCLMIPSRWKKCFGANRPASDFDCASEGRGYSLHVHKSARLALASAMLGQNLSQRDIRTAQDRAVIDHLLKSAFEDLAGRIESAFQHALAERELGPEPQRKLFLPVTCGNVQSALRLVADIELAVRLLRESAAPARDHAPPAPVGAALNALDVKISARLGTSRISLGELETLAVGDVLTLEAACHSPVAACLNGQPKGEAAISLLPQEDRLMLQIERPASQW